MDDITQDDINALWEAANTNCAIITGEYLDADFEGDDMPPRPSPRKVIQDVTEYLKNSM